MQQQNQENQNKTFEYLLLSGILPAAIGNGWMDGSILSINVAYALYAHGHGLWGNENKLIN
jgi:hypothetical protein